MICDPCREAADSETGLIRLDPSWTPLGHAPALCHDHGREIRACGCQHRPVTRPDQPQESTDA